MKSKTIWLIIILILIAGSIYYLQSTRVAPVETINQQISAGPELFGIEGYLNTPGGLTLESLKGKTVLVDFWTYSCINCIRTLPFLTEWDRKYRDKGLVIVGVHTPEFEFEKDIDNVRDAVVKYNIKYPVVLDNNYTTWVAFGNRFWPHKYLINPEGQIVYDHIGEGGYEETELKIQELLSEMGEDVSGTETTKENDELRLVTTPELYTGFDFALPRGQDIGNPEGLHPDKSVLYSLPTNFAENAIYLSGLWKSNSDNLELKDSNGSVVLRFKASSLNIVANSPRSQQIEVFIEDSPLKEEQAGEDVIFQNGRAFVKIDNPRLYNVVDGKFGDYKLELKIPSEGFTFNAFTFG